MRLEAGRRRVRGECRLNDDQLGLFAIVALGIVAVFAGTVLLVLHLLRLRCPTCREPKLEVDLRDRSDGRVPGLASAYKFRCQACGEEFRREDGGPMIAKAAWDAGARTELPRARVHR